MNSTPPKFPERVLRLALGEGADGRAVLGDLREDFARLAADRGRIRARVWYWREALALSVGFLAKRLLTMARSHSRARGTDFSVSSSLRKLGVVHDLRFVLRSMRKDWGFFSLAGLIFGLGVGASVSVFSVMSPLLLRPLPVGQPERLVWVANSAGTGMSGVTSRAFNLRDFRAMARSFTGISGYNAFFEQGSYNLLSDGPPENLVGVDVAHDFLEVLGVPPVLGRSFSVEEGQWGGPAAVILTHRLWQRRFDADPSIVGRSITLNNAPHLVVGVLPASFDFSSTFSPRTRVDFLRPFPISAETDRWGNTLSIVGRLRPAATVETAQADLSAVLAGLRAADPERWGVNGVTVTALQEHIAGPFRGGLLLLAAASGAVMLIVCVNLANLLLARGAKRTGEIALRNALGATRGRLVRQLLIESVVLSIAGAGVGVAVAVFVTRWAAGTSGIEIPMLQSVTVDPLALGFSLSLAVVAGLMTGVVPAIHVSRGDGLGAVNRTTRGPSAGGRQSARLREALVVSEVALACVLLVFGGLFLRSFQNVLGADLGFRAEGLVSWRLSATRPFEERREGTVYFDRIVDDLLSVPGVEAVGLTDALPLGRNRGWSARPQGMAADADEWMSVFPHVVDWRYPEAMRIPLIAGRYLTRHDTEESEQVALLNETAAEQLFRGEDPLGRVVETWTEWTIIGVVADVRHRSLEMGSGPEMYFPLTQLGPFSALDMVVRSSLPPEALVPSVVASLRSTDPALPTGDFETLQAVVDRSVSPRRFTLLVLGSFAATALILAALGVYGVLSYSVAERVPEIGIRMALGESASRVLGRVVGRTLMLAGIGVGIGAGLALAGGRLVGALLYGVDAADPVSFLAVSVLILTVAGVAGFLPARRAAKTDPVAAFRSM